MNDEKVKKNQEHSVGGKVPEVTGHVYDGISEYDNPMPRWWVWMFWGSFYFALAYFVHYQITGNGTSVEEEYLNDLAHHEEAQAKLATEQDISEELLAGLVSNQSSVSKGKETFMTRCALCHGDGAEGKIGPNLTDNAWINGDGSLMAIHEIISEGVLAKGMPAWGKQLAPDELLSVVSFVGSLRGSNATGKAPEGKTIE